MTKAKNELVLMSIQLFDEWGSGEMKYFVSSGLVLTVACLMPAQSFAIGTIKKGNDSCGYDQLIIHGTKQLILEREGDGSVDVSHPHVTWTCHNANGKDKDGSVDCPDQTNLFHAHRQKSDNDEWLWECQVK